ncbi:MAG: alpha/beta hydrolase [Myxococcota bacterium]|nr:alpha/beta hydrolase [Myxococcota bacterium]
MTWITLPGVPLGARAFDRLQTEMSCHRFIGLSTSQYRDDWGLDSFVEEVSETVASRMVLGHDFGGLIGAIASLRVSMKALVLTGSALGHWWCMTRWSALPGLHYFFYRAFQGQLFAQRGLSQRHRVHFERDFAGYLSLPNLSERMRRTAQNIYPPKRLAQQLTVPLFLIWGKNDPWYPPVVARRISKATGAPIYWIDGGHYCMWESPAEFDRALMKIERKIA